MTSADDIALTQDSAENRGSAGVRETATLLVHDSPGSLASQDVAEVAHLGKYVNIWTEPSTSIVHKLWQRWNLRTS